MSATRREGKPRSDRDMALAESLPAAVDISRIAAGMTHEALADRLGVSRAHITMLQTGKRRWTADAILKVCRVTGDKATIQWLCRKAGGSFVPMSPAEQRLAEAEAEREEAAREVEKERAA
jgi:transcriptional regulator with XRE-family HTH domain